MRTKAELRDKLKHLAKNSLTTEKKYEFSQLILRKILSEPLFLKAKEIALFAPLFDEPDLMALISEYKGEKNFYLPRVEGIDINYYPIDPERKNLSKGAFGILEPKNTTHEAINPQTLDYVIIPATAYDSHRYRLGRGKGFYDRFIPRLQKNTIKLGVSFNLLPIENIPKDSWDLPVDIVITPSTIY